MKKWLLLPVLGAVLLLAYVVAGPYLAIRGIQHAFEAQDMGALERHVDFPALRLNLRAQVEDWLARQAGEDLRGTVLGDIGLRIASGAAGGVVDAAATPMGIAAIIQGRSVLLRTMGRTRDGDSYSAPPDYDPFRDVRHRFESHERFVATARDPEGAPIDFVFQRQGLRWRLVDIALDPDPRPAD